VSTENGAAPILPPSARSTDEKLQWLQSLRGVAALMVLFFHLAPHWALVPQLQALSKLMHWGFSGVDVFFVLSGFVVYQSGSRSIPRYGFFSFFKKRSARIFFTYWPTFFIVTLASIVFFDNYPKSIEQTLRSFFLLYPKFWDNWIPVAWSLTYELYFYFVLGGLLLLPKIYHTRAILAVTLSVALWNLSWLYFETDLVYKDSHPWRFILGGFIIEFMAGALIAIAFDARRDKFHFKWSRFLCLLAITAIGFHIGSQSFYYNQVEIMRVGSYGLTAIAALLGALILEESKYRPPSWAIKIGDCSFSLYLIHASLLGCLGTFRHQFLGHQKTWWLEFSLLMPVLIIMTSYLWYLALEVRTIRWVKSI
jgi:exopolysaccharide production protein ExoZ